MGKHYQNYNRVPEIITEKELDMGIENIKEVLLFICRLTGGIVKSAEDGFSVWKDWPNFIDAAKALIPAIKDFKEIPGEYADLDEAERAELVKLIQDEFDIPDDKVEAFIEQAFRVALDLADLVELGFETF